MSLRHFPFNYGFQKKKKKPDMTDKTLPNWVKINKHKIDVVMAM